jgi:hypothetical protein
MEEFMKLSTITKTAMVLLVCSTMQLANAGGLNLFKNATNDLRNMSEVQFLADLSTNVSSFQKTPSFRITLQRTASSHEILSDGISTRSIKRFIELEFVNMSPGDGEYFLIMQAGSVGETMTLAIPEIERIAALVKKALLKSKSIRSSQNFGQSMIEGLKGNSQVQISVLVNSPEHLQRIIRNIDQAIKEANIELSASNAQYLAE